MIDTLLAILGLVLGAVLFLPVDLRARADPDLTADDFESWRNAGLPWQAAVTWGWGLLRVWVTGEGYRLTGTRFTICGLRPRRPSRSRSPAARAGAVRKRPRSRRLDLQTVLDLLREGWRLVVRLGHMLRLQAEGALTYGLPDPALTGWVLGARATLWRGGDLRLTPDFLGPRLTGWVQITGRFFGAEVLEAFLAALWSPPIRRRWTAAIKLKLRRTIVRRGGRAACL